MDIDYNIFFERYSLKCSPLIPTISGTFESFTITDGNETIIWVNNCVGLNTTTGKLFNTKSLTPDKLGLGGIVVNYKPIIDNLSSVYEEHISQPLIGLLESSNTCSDKIPINLLPFNVKDLSTISKDYGEILSSIWVKKRFNFEYIEFPTKSNEKMIDFYGVRYGIKYPISVKSGNGSKVNLQNILDIMLSQSKDVSTVENEISLKVIKIVNDLSVKESIIFLHKEFNTKGINKLAKIMNVPVADINLQSVTNFIENDSITNLKTILTPLYESMNTYIKDSTWYKTDDKLRFVLSPLGENIWRVLNDNKEMKDSLCRVARKVTLLQINVDVHKDKIVFKHNKFKDSMFEFNWAGYSSGNKLGFKMIQKE